MKLELEDPQLKALISEAIFTSLTQEKKDALISTAISNLMAPAENHGSGPKITVLQREFNESIRCIARDVITKEIEGNSEIKQKINGMIADAVTLMTETNRESLVAKVSEAIYRGLTQERY